jgi:hypothetical protein
MTTSAVFIRNGRLDVVAVNPLGQAFYAPVFDSPVNIPGQPPNLARYWFLDPKAGDFYDAEAAADANVAILRAEAGRDPYNKDLTDLIGELSTRSEMFRTRWAAQNVRNHTSGVKTFNHPVVGELDLSYEAMEMSADAGLTLTAFIAEPGSPSADALSLLATWAATHLNDAPVRTERNVQP